MPKMLKKTHPESIYLEPTSNFKYLKIFFSYLNKHFTYKFFLFIIFLIKKDGMIYFVEGNTVGSDFGFPRVEIKKRYRWFYF